MTALFKRFIILLALCSGCAVAVPYGLVYHDTVYVNDSREHIVVERGCKHIWSNRGFPLDETLPQDSLLAMVYGSDVSPDSAGLYEKWGNQCLEYADMRAIEIWGIPIGIVLGGLGTYLTFYVDYEHAGTAILGRTFGVWGLLVAAYSIADGVFSAVISSKQRNLGKFYKKEAERFKLNVAPMINFNEPGGGLFLQLGF